MNRKAFFGKNFLKTGLNSVMIVVKLGGSAQDDPEILKHIFVDCQIMLAVGMRPVIVYGGGKFITRAMKDTGQSARFINGQVIAVDGGWLAARHPPREAG